MLFSNFAVQFMLFLFDQTGVKNQSFSRTNLSWHYHLEKMSTAYNDLMVKDMKRLSNKGLMQSRFIRHIVGHLSTFLTVPEEEFISRGSPGKEIFFIVKGDCYVDFENRENKVSVAARLLTEGDHFGEISLLYKCPRTASVSSRNYNTMARLS